MGGTLSIAPSSTEKPRSRRGGRRAGAGRKKLTKDVSHAARPPLSNKHPVHVMLRTKRGVPKLRQRCMYQAIRRVLIRYLGRDEFRVVHISIQNSHLHLIVEAGSRRALTRSMQSFSINAARAINAAWGRAGKVFEFRYNAKQIKTPLYARNAISYVLNNWRRHREDFADGRASKAILDEYSSAISFGGWTGRSTGKRYKPPRDYEPLPVSAPQTSLLSFDWEWFGLIDPHERPGPLVR